MVPWKKPHEFCKKVRWFEKYDQIALNGSRQIMNTQDGSKGGKEQEYLSKRVLVNGQFVTLYSINGQTWLSSPEEIPELMARLENARIMLANPEKPEGESQQAKAAPAEAPAPKIVQNKYRMKGPKPRPILKQGGVVIKGTPIEPISASGTVVSFSHDQEIAEETSASSKVGRAGSQKTKLTAKAKNNSPKHIAPVLAAPGKVKKAALPQKPVAKVSSGKPPVAAKSKAAPAAVKQPAAKAQAPVKASVTKKSAPPERKAAPVKKAAPIKKAANAKVAKPVAKAKSQKVKAKNSNKKSSR